MLPSELATGPMNCGRHQAAPALARPSNRRPAPLSKQTTRHLVARPGHATCLGAPAAATQAAQARRLQPNSQNHGPTAPKVASHHQRGARAGSRRRGATRQWGKTEMGNGHPHDRSRTLTETTKYSAIHPVAASARSNRDSGKCVTDFLRSERSKKNSKWVTTGRRIPPFNSPPILFTNFRRA